MKVPFWSVAVLGIALAGNALAGAGEEGSLAKKTAERIRAEALRRAEDPDGRPLPLASHWNTGGTGQGFTPGLAPRLIDQGHFLLPWIQMPSPLQPKAPGGIDQAVERLAQLGLPLTLVSTQWERLLTADPAFLRLPYGQNPNVVRPAGKVELKITPFGPIEPWREVGARWGGSQGMNVLERLYPRPPLVLFLSNNEHTKLRWTEVETCRYYLDRFGTGKDDEFKRKVVGDGWIERYRALEEAMRSQLASAGWRESARFVGYNAFGPAHFARWPGWPAHALAIPGRIDPWPDAFDGASVPYYANNWEAITDFTVYSPQVQAMNWVFMLEEVRRKHPDFWFELSVWDGWAPGRENDKRAYYFSRGQVYSPDRYAGMVQFGMWLLRPRVVREFRAHTQRLDECLPFFLALVESVDRVHEEPLLAEFWRKGTLVANPAAEHPYQSEVPPGVAKAPRWFRLDTDQDPGRPWRLGTQLAVYALALVQGEPGERRWLVYAHAPLGRRQGVEVTIPDYGGARIDVAPGGTFHLVTEKDRSVRRLASGPPAVR